MTRRLPAPFALVLGLAAAAVLAAAPAPAHAAPIEYELKNNGTTAWTNVLVLNVNPPGAIPSGSQVSPLTPNKAASHGFDEAAWDAIKVSLASGTYKDGPMKGQPVEVVPLSFGARGLPPGADLDFALTNVDPKFQGKIALSLPPGATGLTLKPVEAAAAVAAVDRPVIHASTPIVHAAVAHPMAIPEPASLALWGALGGLGLAGARARRRARPA